MASPSNSAVDRPFRLLEKDTPLPAGIGLNALRTDTIDQSLRARRRFDARIRIIDALPAALPTLLFRARIRAVTGNVYGEAGVCRLSGVLQSRCRRQQPQWQNDYRWRVLKTGDQPDLMPTNGHLQVAATSGADTRQSGYAHTVARGHPDWRRSLATWAHCRSRHKPSSTRFSMTLSGRKNPQSVVCAVTPASVVLALTASATGSIRLLKTSYQRDFLALTAAARRDRSVAASMVGVAWSQPQVQHDAAVDRSVVCQMYHICVSAMSITHAAHHLDLSR